MSQSVFEKTVGGEKNKNFVINVNLGLRTSLPGSLGCWRLGDKSWRRTSVSVSTATGGGGGHFPLTLLGSLLAPSKPVIELPVLCVPFRHVTCPSGLLLGDILRDPGGQNPIQSLLLSPHCLQLEGKPGLKLGMREIKLPPLEKFLKHILLLFEVHKDLKLVELLLLLGQCQGALLSQEIFLS